MDHKKEKDLALRIEHFGPGHVVDLADGKKIKNVAISGAHPLKWEATGGGHALLTLTLVVTKSAIDAEMFRGNHSEQESHVELHHQE